jgi:hypothetical protein
MIADHAHGTLDRFDAREWFASGEQGAWYDPNDLSTLFQDAAGTVPVTAVEQPVGKMLDKSGRNNHATQATAANRPVLSARVNMLTKTEDFTDAAWVKYVNGVTVTQNATTAPDGSNTGIKIAAANAVNNLHFIYQAPSKNTTQTSFTATLYVKAAEYSTIVIQSQSGANGVSCTFNTVSLVAAMLLLGAGFTNVSASVVDVGGGWFKLSHTYITDSTASIGYGIYLRKNDGATAWNGSGTDGIYIWHPDLRPTNAGYLLPPYQRVTTATDYDTVGFPKYLKFDGVNDFLATGNIDFTATDKMTVVAGLRKLSDAVVGVLLEFGVAPANLSFTLATPGSPTPTYLALLRGISGQSYYFPSPYAAPRSDVFSCLFDIAGSDISTQIFPKINAVLSQVAPTVGPIGIGGKFGNYPLYLGIRGGTLLPFNGHLYGLIVCGAARTTDRIRRAEYFMSRRTGIQL